MQGAVVYWINCVSGKKLAHANQYAVIIGVGVKFLTDPSTACERQEEQQRLVASLARLSEEEREALLMRYFKDMSHEEIAEGLGRSERTVRRLLRAGKLKLGMALRGIVGQD